MSTLIGAMFESIRLPWRFVLSGKTKGKRGKLVRWVEGHPPKRGVRWSHIYNVVGWPPYTPKTWRYAEPTLKGVKLGWDVVGAKKSGKGIPLPELAGPGTEWEQAVYFDDDYYGDATTEAAKKGLIAIVKKDDDRLHEHVYKRVKKGLHPRNLLPLLILGIITGALSDRVRRAIKGKK